MGKPRDIADSAAVINYIDNVSADVNTNLASKQDSDQALTDISGLTHSDGSFIVSDGTNFVLETGNTALASMGVTATNTELNKLDGVTATTAELNYVDGVTSAIQTQLDGKQTSDAQLTDIAGLTPTDGNIIIGNGANFVTESGATARTSLGLGTSSSVQHGSLGVGTGASGTSGEIRATNNITAYYSDERLKTKLGDISDALNKVESLSGFYYEANETAQALGYEAYKEVGVSAQEVQAVMPEAVAPAPIDDKYLTVRYEKLVPLLIEAIKELSQKVADLEAK